MWYLECLGFLAFGLIIAGPALKSLFWETGIFVTQDLIVQSCLFSRIVGESEGLVPDTKLTEGPQPSGKGALLF